MTPVFKAAPEPPSAAWPEQSEPGSKPHGDVGHYPVFFIFSPDIVFVLLTFFLTHDAVPSGLSCE